MLYPSGSRENPESPLCPLSRALAHEESPAALSPRLVDCASTQLLQRGSEKTSRTPGRPCSVQSHLTSPLLTRLWVEQTAIGIPNGSGARASPLTASPVTDSWVTPVPTTSSLHTTATQTNPRKVDISHLIHLLSPSHCLSPSSHCLLRSQRLSSTTSFS